MVVSLLIFNFLKKSFRIAYELDRWFVVQTLSILVGFYDTIHGVCHSQTSSVTHRKIPLWKIKLEKHFSEVSLQYKAKHIVLC